MCKTLKMAVNSFVVDETATEYRCMSLSNIWTLQGISTMFCFGVRSISIPSQEYQKTKFRDKYLILNFKITVKNKYLILCTLSG